MKKKIIAMLAAMMCLASSSLSYSSVAIAANSLNSNDIAEVKISSSNLKECNLVTESKNDGCWINFDLVSGAFAMSGNNHQSFSIIGSFERKDNDLYLYPENGSAEFYILHREEDHFVSQSDEIGVQLKADLVFYADNDAFWEILLDWTLSGNEPSNTGETAEQNTPFIMGDVNDDDTFEDAECAMTVTVSEINGETLLVKSSDGKGELLTLSTKYLDSSIQPKVGMKLEVVYTGGILQTYPCQFGNVKKVSVVSDNTTLMGDVNADGEFGIADVILLQKWLLAVPDTHLANWKAANFCDDDRLNVFDLCLMKRALIEQHQQRQITVDDIVSLSKKGDDLTVADFAPFKGEDIGSGLYVMKYEVAGREDQYYLLVGSDGSDKPDYAKLVNIENDGKWDEIDIRSEEFQNAAEIYENWNKGTDTEENRASARTLGDYALEKLKDGTYSLDTVIDSENASELMDEGTAALMDKDEFTSMEFLDEHTVMINLNYGLLGVQGYLVTDGTLTFEPDTQVSVPDNGFDGNVINIEWADGNLYYFTAGL